VRARLIAVVLGFVVVLLFDALIQIGVNFATGGNGFFITPAQAKKGHERSKKDDSRDDREGERQAQTKDSGSNSGTDGKSNNDGKSNSNDDSAPSSTRSTDSLPQGTARNSGSAPQAEKAEPPKTVVEAVKRLFKWMQTKPQAIAPWAEAKITRAATGESEPAVAREKLAQKGDAVRRPAIRTTPGSVRPQPGTYRPNELLVLDANPAVLRELHARGWSETTRASEGVVRLLSETENSLVASEQLQVQFPGTRFGLNFVYSLANEGVSHRPIDVLVDARSCAPERCYGPALINWRADLASCAAGVKIGLIDTAVDEAHSALAWRRLTVHRPAHHEAINEPLDWHGTAVVSLLVGNSKSGTPGLIPDADYVIANAFFRNKSGQSETDSEHLLWALKLLEQNGAQIVNMSLSGPRDDLVYQRLVQLSRQGMVFVAAAGNGGPAAPAAYPAAYKDEVIAVTAVDRNQQLYDHANRGDYIDVAAPGVRIWTALPNNKEGAMSGTSFAAPFVTAIVAAIYKQTLLPELIDKNHSRAPEAVTLAHLSTSKLTRDEKVGLGLVQAPPTCGAAERQLAPSAKLAPSIEVGGGWNTLVRHAFSLSAN
jgi:subtilisin family serine protease